MAKYFIEDTTLTAMADKIRALTGNTGSLTPAQMTTEVQEAKEDVDSAMDALETLGITIPEGSDIGDLAGLVGEVESGIDTSDATATSADILANKTAYVDGEKITGSIATKTSSNLSASGATVTVPAGYYASQATKSVATATQATPSVSVSSSGLITASATQTAGYVSAGTKSGTKQLTTQAAKTVTPTTSNQTAVSSGRYTTGAITVKGDSNLVAGNIKKGVSIFGVSGSLESGTNTSDATATADDIMSGKTAYVSSGKATGTFTLDSEITTQEDLISTIKTALENKSAGGGGSVETCTVTINVPENAYFDFLTATIVNEGVVESYLLNSNEIYAAYGTTITLNCVVGSFIAVGPCSYYEPLDSTVSGDCEVIPLYNGKFAIKITGTESVTIGFYYRDI